MREYARTGECRHSACSPEHARSLSLRVSTGQAFLPVLNPRNPRQCPVLRTGLSYLAPLALF